MKKSALAILLLAGASMVFGAPQNTPQKPNEPGTKTEAQKTAKKKSRRHKKGSKHQQTQNTLRK